LWVALAIRNLLINDSSPQGYARRGLGLPLALKIETGREAMLAALREVRESFQKYE